MNVRVTGAAATGTARLSSSESGTVVLGADGESSSEPGSVGVVGVLGEGESSGFTVVTPCSTSISVPAGSSALCAATDTVGRSPPPVTALAAA